MNYGEEQRNELEALSEIYFNEIKIISSEHPISFSIKVRPQASSYDENERQQSNTNHDSDGEEKDYEESDDDDDDYGDDADEGSSDHDADRPTNQGVGVELRFDLPEKYPDEKPSIQILGSHNLAQDELASLMQILSEKAEENLGTVMVFMLVSDVVEWLIRKTEQTEVELEQEQSEKQKQIEAEERKRFEGTPVTEANFIAWKTKFDAEMLKLKFEQQKQRADQGDSRRLTGRAMFESDNTLAESDLNFVEDLDQNQIEALLHNIDEVDLDADYNTEPDEDEDTDNEDDDDDDDDDDVDLEELDISDDSDEKEAEKVQKGRTAKQKR